MAKDPYRYFRVEAQELVEALGRDLLLLERAGDAETVRRLLRSAHTLKGAARVVKQAQIAELAHRIEDLLAPHRDEQSPQIAGTIDRMLASVDEIRSWLARLDAPQAAAAAPASTAEEVAPRSVRVAIDELDAMLAGVMEARAALAALMKGRGKNGAKAGPEDPMANQTAIGEIDSELVSLYERVFEMRLIPASTIATDLERAARDAARALGKEVTFRASGAETRVDAHVLFALRGALLHAVQNAVAHGIDRKGAIDLSIERRGHRVAFGVSDDGRGFDVELIRKIAVERGLIGEQASRRLDSEAAVALLLRGRFSTSRTITEVSGRGVGLDVVRETVERLKGELEVKTERGRGSTVAMTVPISLSSMPALSVEVGGAAALIPLDAVRRTVRLEPKDVSRTKEGERASIDGQVIPFVSLSRALGRAAPARRTKVRTLVIVDAGGRRAAVEVDRLGAIENVLVRSLPEHVAADAIVAGAALDEAGVPQLLLAPPALVQAADRALEEEAEREIPRPEVLVIDDSLTTRMLEQSILESAGYRVDLATSAEEALEKARHKSYRLFVVDVEMPGMDGFEFISRTRADPELRHIPSILVTSRNDEQDLRRGKEVGARAYIVKSEFDQRALLETIERLIG